MHACVYIYGGFIWYLKSGRLCMAFMHGIAIDVFVLPMVVYMWYVLDVLLKMAVSRLQLIFGPLDMAVDR